MKTRLERLVADVSGATAVEYALIAGLIAIVLTTALGPVQIALAGAFRSVAEAMPQP